MASDLAEQIAHKTAGFIQSSAHRDLLDIIDALRSHGVSHYVDLPQIIVCGSQSSGKSSTLESISGIGFPTAEGLCTRFATELVLRRGDGDGHELRVHIQPGAGRDEADRARLAGFSLQTADVKDLGRIVEAAKKAMGLSGEGARIFSTDVLRIESTSPTAPNLTLVDLPGLFGAADKNQSDDDAALVQAMVTNYMKQRRSIILAVVAADNPFANQPVTKFARDIDPEGTRTLGLITKPDKIDRGSDTETYYVELAQNLNVKLHLGWHVLRNRSHATSDDTADERDAREAEFFHESAWKAMPKSKVGVESLRERLREILWKHIEQGLPGVKSDVQSGIKDCKAKLAQLGRSRASRREKHTYLQRISRRLSVLIRAAIDGVYADPFFESFVGQQDAFDRRLRANVQKLLTGYSVTMSVKGHALEIVENHEEPVREVASRYMYREHYLELVEKLMEECRGRELPGTYNPLVVGDLFARQCKPWAAMTQNLVELIHQAAATTFNKLALTVSDGNTASRLMKHHIQPALHALRKDLQAKVEELLQPHVSVHPITYNGDLTEHVQAIQSRRHKRKFDHIVEQYASSPQPTILQALREGTLPVVKDYSASLAADVAAAYYSVALNKFVDDVSVNAIETCLIQRLPDVFCSDVVWDLSDEAIDQLGSENDATVQERIELTKKLGILDKGLRDLDAFTTRSGRHA